MKYYCGYCEKSFPTLDELNLHRAHEHPRLDVSFGENYYRTLERRYNQKHRR